MRRASLLVALMTLALVPATPAAAATGTASDFAGDCDDDGFVNVTGRERYVGGTASFLGRTDAVGHICTVVIAEEGTLVLRDVTLTGDPAGGAVNLVVVGAPDTTIKVIDSSIEVSNFLELTLGCGSGEEDEFGGRVQVQRSTLAGSVVLLCTSIGADGGRTVVRDSTITGGAFDTLPSVQIQSGPNGRTSVVRSQISGDSGIDISSGAGGRTTVLRNSFDGPVAITSFGRCRSLGNSPAVPCT